MKEKELHFLHGRPRRAPPEGGSDYAGLQQSCGDLMRGGVSGLDPGNGSHRQTRLSCVATFQCP